MSSREIVSEPDEDDEDTDLVEIDRLIAKSFLAHVIHEILKESRRRTREESAASPKQYSQIENGHLIWIDIRYALQCYNPFRLESYDVEMALFEHESFVKEGDRILNGRPKPRLMFAFSLEKIGITEWF